MPTTNYVIPHDTKRDGHIEGMLGAILRYFDCDVALGESLVRYAEDLVANHEDKWELRQTEEPWIRGIVSDLDGSRRVTSFTEAAENTGRVSCDTPGHRVLRPKSGLMHPAMVPGRRKPREIHVLNPQGVGRPQYRADVEGRPNVFDNNRDRMSLCFFQIGRGHSGDFVGGEFSHVLALRCAAWCSGGCPARATSDGVGRGSRYNFIFTVFYRTESARVRALAIALTQ